MSKNKTIKVYSDSNVYLSWLDDRFSKAELILDADIILFIGGQDVNPKNYGESIGKWTMFDSSRDAEDDKLWRYCGYNGKFSVGICRGAQYLCVKAGGRLFQDVTGHAIAGHHTLTIPHNYFPMLDCDITNALSYNLTITSTHHQMMNPYNLKEGSEYEIIAWSEDVISMYYLDGNNQAHMFPYEDEQFVEPEVVYFPKTQSLAIQGHPERMDKKSRTVKFLNDLLYDKYIEANT